MVRFHYLLRPELSVVNPYDSFYKNHNDFHLSIPREVVIDDDKDKPR